MTPPRGPVPDPVNRSVRFDMTITLGNVLTILGLVLAGFSGWMLMEKRIVVLEEWRLHQGQRDALQDATAKEMRDEIRDSLRDLRSAVEKHTEKLDRYIERRKP